MSSFERPADDRHDALLATAEASNRPHGEGAICPLMSGTVQLLPLRYGLVAEPPPPEAPVPYTLEAMPMGLRLMRNGYLYVLDGKTLELHEYDIKDHALADAGAIGGHNGGKLEYPTDRTLHVCFSEVAWTEAKRAQVRDSEADREAFMQAVNLAGAGPVHGGEHLIPPYRAATQVAEFAGRRLGGDADLYGWENEPYFHETRIGKLFEQHGVDEPDECLCLLVRDDIGVMRDLAQLQDVAVAEIDAWAQEDDGRIERDFVLANYIESVTQLDVDALRALAEGDAETVREALWDDLEDLDDDATRQAVTELLNRDAPLPDVDRRHWSSATHEALRDIDDEIAARHERVYGTVGGWRLEHEVANLGAARQRREALLHRERVRGLLTGADADATFVDAHLDDLVDLHREQRRRVDAMLDGASFGQRGVNGLIRREEMDAFLAEHRDALADWNDWLARIIADRTAMWCSGRFHTAAWYFDPRDEAQVREAFLTEYAVIRDIGRSDEANEALFAWLQDNPHFDRPMFYALSVADRTALSRDYTVLYDAGYGLLSETAAWIDRLAGLEAGKLPDVAELDEGARAAADSVRANLTLAVDEGISRAMSALTEALGAEGPMPSIEDLFRHGEMPKVLGPRLIDAARRGELHFRVADAEFDAFRQLLRRVLDEREGLRRVNNEIRQAQSEAGHRSRRVQELKVERRAIQERLARYEPALAQSLSPVELPSNETPLILAEGDESLAKARAGITLILPEAQHQEVHRLIQQARLGISSTARVVSVGGDGLSLAIFVAQAVNLVQAIQVLDSLPSHASTGVRNQAWLTMFNAAFATGAAGFLAAQGIGDTVLTHQARALGEALGEGRISTRLGMMHYRLGMAGYGLGLVAAGFGLYDNGGRWREALRSGNAEAQQGALLAMGGNLGMMGAHGYGVWVTALEGAAVKQGATSWAAAGARLTSLFWRVNLLGLAFTALELAGTWMYNRHNLSEHDRWLLASPWGTEPADLPLREHLEALRQVLQPTHVVAEARYGETFMPNWFDRLTQGIRHPVRYIFTLHLPNVAPALLDALGGEPPLRVALKVWRLTPAGPRGRWTAARWHEITDEWTSGMAIVTEGTGHGGLVLVGATPPEERGKVRYVVGLRYRWPDGEGGHRDDEQYVLIRPRHGRGTGDEHRYVPGGVDAPSAYGEWREIAPAELP